MAKKKEPRDEGAAGAESTLRAFERKPIDSRETALTEYERLVQVEKGELAVAKKRLDRLWTKLERAAGKLKKGTPDAEVARARLESFSSAYESFLDGAEGVQTGNASESDHGMRPVGRGSWREAVAGLAGPSGRAAVGEATQGQGDGGDLPPAGATPPAVEAEAPTKRIHTAAEAAERLTRALGVAGPREHAHILMEDNGLEVGGVKVKIGDAVVITTSKGERECTLTGFQDQDRGPRKGEPRAKFRPVDGKGFIMVYVTEITKHNLRPKEVPKPGREEKTRERGKERAGAEPDQQPRPFEGHGLLEFDQEKLEIKLGKNTVDLRIRGWDDPQVVRSEFDGQVSIIQLIYKSGSEELRLQLEIDPENKQRYNLVVINPQGERKENSGGSKMWAPERFQDGLFKDLLSIKRAFKKEQKRERPAPPEKAGKETRKGGRGGGGEAKGTKGEGPDFFEPEIPEFEFGTGKKLDKVPETEQGKNEFLAQNTLFKFLVDGDAVKIGDEVEYTTERKDERAGRAVEWKKANVVDVKIVHGEPVLVIEDNLSSKRQDIVDAAFRYNMRPADASVRDQMNQPADEERLDPNLRDFIQVIRGWGEKLNIGEIKVETFEVAYNKGGQLRVRCEYDPANTFEFYYDPAQGYYEQDIQLQGLEGAGEGSPDDELKRGKLPVGHRVGTTFDNVHELDPSVTRHGKVAKMGIVNMAERLADLLSRFQRYVYEIKTKGFIEIEGAAGRDAGLAGEAGRDYVMLEGQPVRDGDQVIYKGKEKLTLRFEGEGEEREIVLYEESGAEFDRAPVVYWDTLASELKMGERRRTAPRPATEPAPKTRREPTVPAGGGGEPIRTERIRKESRIEAPEINGHKLQQNDIFRFFQGRETVVRYLGTKGKGDELEYQFALLGPESRVLVFSREELLEVANDFDFVNNIPPQSDELFDRALAGVLISENTSLPNLQEKLGLEDDKKRAIELLKALENFGIVGPVRDGKREFLGGRVLEVEEPEGAPAAPTSGAEVGETSELERMARRGAASASEDEGEGEEGEEEGEELSEYTFDQVIQVEGENNLKFGTQTVDMTLDYFGTPQEIKILEDAGGKLVQIVYSRDRARRLMQITFDPADNVFELEYRKVTKSRTSIISELRKSFGSLTLEEIQSQIAHRLEAWKEEIKQKDQDIAESSLEGEEERARPVPTDFTQDFRLGDTVLKKGDKMWYKDAAAAPVELVVAGEWTNTETGEKEVAFNTADGRAFRSATQQELIDHADKFLFEASPEPSKTEAGGELKKGYAFELDGEPLKENDALFYRNPYEPEAPAKPFLVRGFDIEKEGEEKLIYTPVDEDKKIPLQKEDWEFLVGKSLISRRESTLAKPDEIEGIANIETLRADMAQTDLLKSVGTFGVPRIDIQANKEKVPPEIRLAANYDDEHAIYVYITAGYRFTGEIEAAGGYVVPSSIEKANISGSGKDEFIQKLNDAVSYMETIHEQEHRVGSGDKTGETASERDARERLESSLQLFVIEGHEPKVFVNQEVGRTSDGKIVYLEDHVFVYDDEREIVVNYGADRSFKISAFFRGREILTESHPKEEDLTSEIIKKFLQAIGQTYQPEIPPAEPETPPNENTLRFAGSEISKEQKYVYNSPHGETIITFVSVEGEGDNQKIKAISEDGIAYEFTANEFRQAISSGNLKEAVEEPEHEADREEPEAVLTDEEMQAFVAELEEERSRLVRHYVEEQKFYKKYGLNAPLVREKKAKQWRQRRSELDERRRELWGVYEQKKQELLRATEQRGRHFTKLLRAESRRLDQEIAKARGTEEQKGLLGWIGRKWERAGELNLTNRYDRMMKEIQAKIQAGQELTEKEKKHLAYWSNVGGFRRFVGKAMSVRTAIGLAFAGGAVISTLAAAPVAAGTFMVGRGAAGGLGMGFGSRSVMDRAGRALLGRKTEMYRDVDDAKAKISRDLGLVEESGELKLATQQLAVLKAKKEKKGWSDEKYQAEVEKLTGKLKKKYEKQTSGKKAEKLKTKTLERLGRTDGERLQMVNRELARLQGYGHVNTVDMEKDQQCRDLVQLREELLNRIEADRTNVEVSDALEYSKYLENLTRLKQGNVRREMAIARSGRNKKRLGSAIIGTAFGVLVGTGEVARGAKAAWNWIGDQMDWAAGKLGIVQESMEGAHSGALSPEKLRELRATESQARIDGTKAIDEQRAAMAAEAEKARIPRVTVAPSEPRVVVPIGVEVGPKDGSAWEVIGRQLEAMYGERFSSLPRPQRSYVIDLLSDQYGTDPSRYVSGGVVNKGDQFDFQRLVEDVGGQDRVQAQLDRVLPGSETFDEQKVATLTRTGAYRDAMRAQYGSNWKQILAEQNSSADIDNISDTSQEVVGDFKKGEVLQFEGKVPGGDVVDIQPTNADGIVNVILEDAAGQSIVEKALVLPNGKLSIIEAIADDRSNTSKPAAAARIAGGIVEGPGGGGGYTEKPELAQAAPAAPKPEPVPGGYEHAAYDALQKQFMAWSGIDRTIMALTEESGIAPSRASDFARDYLRQYMEAHPGQDITSGSFERGLHKDFKAAFAEWSDTEAAEARPFAEDTPTRREPTTGRAAASAGEAGGGRPATRVPPAEAPTDEPAVRPTEAPKDVPPEPAAEEPDTEDSTGVDTERPVGAGNKRFTFTINGEEQQVDIQGKHAPRIVDGQLHMKVPLDPDQPEALTEVAGVVRVRDGVLAFQSTDPAQAEGRHLFAIRQDGRVVPMGE